MFKIVRSSNYDDEAYDESFIDVGYIFVSGQENKAQVICNVLNQLDPSGPHYWKVVDDDYQLRVREV